MADIDISALTQPIYVAITFPPAEDSDLEHEPFEAISDEQAEVIAREEHGGDLWEILRYSPGENHATLIWEREPVYHLKYVADNVGSLEEAVASIRAFADELDALGKTGMHLSYVDGGYIFLVRPEDVIPS
jgi:hypothetical protein